MQAMQTAQQHLREISAARSVVYDEERGDRALMTQRLALGIAHYRDGRDSRFADAGGIAERVAFCRYN
jgi:hypothetical protein